MKKLFGSKKEKKDRPASASDSTLRLPGTSAAFYHSSERVSSYSQTRTETKTSTSYTSNVSKIPATFSPGTFPRAPYKPVYERTQKLSERFDRGAPFRASTSAGPGLSYQFPQRKTSVPSTSYFQPTSSPLYKAPTPKPTPMQIDATPFTATSQHFSPRHARQVFPADLQNVLRVQVKKCKLPIGDVNQRVPTYMTYTKGKRGSLLLINNIKFEKHEKERKGAEKDAQHVQDLFKQMGFKVTPKTNLRKSEMKDALASYTKNSELKKYDINVVVMMSHGCGQERSDSTEISGTDGQTLPTSDIVEYFSNKNCPHLTGKPKIFIFQCCRGGNEHKISTDAKSMNNSSLYGDILLAYATIPGFVSYREEVIGSWYIQAICKVFMEHAHNTHVEDMLKMVDGALADQASAHARAQTSSYENRGFKCCYLNPI